ncbi:Phosphoinositide 3-phosphatase [Sparassis crispa]|uniref:Phosphoinositide 3-phosphatase n=1 Tax=Sparassis crispa TaxID=139825 RepID=A0A401GI76_9APHY|nr:Phosphoinositide 3-phosphatase [Sparassis crispa]GBE81805.1 Phosphoinositide 3-phosphatase [Sparassis crispa]
MDAIRVAKVEGVLCSKGGSTLSGTLHLTAHHLIFCYDESEREEMWAPYPLISLVTRLPLTLQGQCPLTVRMRTFESISFIFVSERDAIDVFESVKELTVATSVNQLYAFFYVPNPPLPVQTGWSLYSPREEFGRMGVGSRTKAWRFTDINKDYSFSPTYPARLVVPTRISDTTLQYAVKYRSKGRLPVLTYLHWANYGSITRSSQPMVGLKNNRSIQDEKLIEAIFQSHHSPESRAANMPIYGATATNLIIDARPTTNAMANTAKGAGTENMDHYKDAKKAYLGIDHIHMMRESLGKVVEALREADSLLSSLGASDQSTGEGIVASVLDRQALRRSGWLKHISAIMEGSLLIVRNVHVNSSHVLIHCSDGWDRTAQLSSLSQLCLDPFYRTVRGFQILVEKDWLSFGHKFLDRCGHLSSEKFFLAPVESGGGGGGAEAAQAFLASVQNRFASPNHIKETSPVFHQFLESVRQVQRQFPERFEFNERFLRQLHYHLYSCQFGTFLFNTERDRRVGEGSIAPACDRTVSVWDFFNSPPEAALNLNPDYDPSLDDPTSRAPKADMGVLMPNPKDVRFWHELYGRTDEEMNGKFRQLAQETDIAGPVETVDDETPVIQAVSPPCISLPPSPVTSPPPATPTQQSLARKVFERSQSPALVASSSTSEPLRPRHESLRGMDAQLSPTRRTHELTVPSRTPSPGVADLSASPRAGVSAGQVTDLFSSSNVRSMWGRFSSNASAAFSVVQDAYGGVAKDLRGLSLGGDTGGDELKTREEIGVWGEQEQHERRPSSARGPGKVYTATATNPWSTAKARPNMPSMFLDNPWSSHTPDRESETHSAPELDMPTPTSALPADPTVALPSWTPVRKSSINTLPRSSSRGSTHSTPLISLGADLPLVTHPLPAASVGSTPPAVSPPSSDPLGVGLL